MTLNNALAAIGTGTVANALAAIRTGTVANALRVTNVMVKTR